MKNSRSSSVCSCWSKAVEALHAHRVFAALLLALFLYYLYLAAQIPYGVDDWSWGGSQGVRLMLSGAFNNRFCGNSTEILLARSCVLKTLVMALSFTLLPVAALGAAAEGDLLPDSSCKVFLLMLGSFLLLTVPREVWAQGMSWVAGFSNFCFSGLLLCLYHRLLLRDELHPDRSASPLLSSFALALFAFVLQLYLENITLYVFFLTTALLFVRLLRRKPIGRLLPLFLGCTGGLLVMFSNSLFLTLFREGSALEGYRSLNYDKTDSVIQIVLTMLRRFLGDMSNKLWGRNWVLCLVITGFLLLLALRRRKPLFLLADALYLLYFPVCALFGPITLPGRFPIHYLSGLAEPLFFVLVLLQLLLFWRQNRLLRLLLAASWCSAPLLLLPMVAINPVGPRSYMTTDILLMQFCLLLAAQLWSELGHKARRTILALCALVLTAVCIRRGVIYAQIGRVNRQREAIYRQAREAQPSFITLPAYPHTDYLWITDAKSEHDKITLCDYYGLKDDIVLDYLSPTITTEVSHP